ncbi:SDR family oxidoreductase [Catenuloplanes sp. NPDC051500]|uniref:SDR family oxidoreductase n=1 Tax=Catenuloplanes sp. NPDC051500 TaxID=3363959 RepID=UPI0037A5088A
MTGASTGMGAATARELARRGFHVLAGVRQQADGNAIRAAGIEPIILDITDSSDVAALAERIEGHTLRAVVNNAGVGGIGPVEVLPLDDWRRIFEVNLFGHVAVTQALLPALVRSRGRIVNISSLNGKFVVAGYGPYAASKFALEAMSDALRQEVGPHGVQVVVVEPGGVKTAMASHGPSAVDRVTARLTGDQSKRYGALLQAIPAHVAAFTAAGSTAEEAARTIARAVTERKPRTRYTVGRSAAVLTRLSGLLPDRVLDRMAASDLGRHYPA